MKKVEATLERWVFFSRWLVAPFSVGLLLAILALLLKFLVNLSSLALEMFTVTSDQKIISILTLVDEALIAAGTALAAQTPAPPASAQATPPAPVKESWEEKWLSFSNRALTAGWGLMLLFDGLSMTQDSVNEEQVGDVPAKGEPRADRFFLGGQVKFRKPWTYFFGANFNGLDAKRGEKFSFLDIAVDIPLTSWLGRVPIGRQNSASKCLWLSSSSLLAIFVVVPRVSTKGRRDLIRTALL